MDAAFENGRNASKAIGIISLSTNREGLNDKTSFVSAVKNLLTNEHKGIYNNKHQKLLPLLGNLGFNETGNLDNDAQTAAELILENMSSSFKFKNDCEKGSDENWNTTLAIRFAEDSADTFDWNTLN